MKRRVGSVTPDSSTIARHKTGKVSKLQEKPKPGTTERERKADREKRKHEGNGKEGKWREENYG